MSEQRRLPIESIVVLGAGLVGLSAALAFRHALPRAAIRLVETPPDPSALADRLPALLPGANGLHLMGVDEEALVAGGVATHRLAQRFDDWRADGTPWVHGHGATGRAGLGSAFHQLWRISPGGFRFDHYNLAAMMAEAGRFIPPSDARLHGDLGFDYAVRLDPARAVALFTRIARERGVVVTVGALAGLTRIDDGDVSAIHLSTGEECAADLYIDCSGPSAPLLADRRRDEWRALLGYDQLLLLSEPGTAPSPLDRYIAHDSGWTAIWPLGERTLHANVSATQDEEETEQRLGEDPGAGERVTFRPSAVPAPWQRNTLALGDAAAATGPLGWAGLALAHAHLALALELLPGRDFHSLELKEYNRRAGLRTARVRDFLAVHNIASDRRTGSFWGRKRPQLPPSLHRTLSEYSRRGVLPAFEEETFDREDWLAVMIGLGMPVAGPDPTMVGIDRAVIERHLARVAGEVSSLVAPASPYPEYMRRMARA